MPADPRITTHASAAALADSLAAQIQAELQQAIAARGKALLVISGGSTPRRLLETLSQTSLDWSAVTVTLADERWVPNSDPRSNAALAEQTLLRNAATAARFLPMFRDDLDIDDAAREYSTALYDCCLPIDVLLLGMGNDGHTASLFPQGDQLSRAMAPDCSDIALPMHAPGAPEPRITLTLPTLASARHIHLHIEGQGKQQVLRHALASRDLPIARVLAAAGARADVHTCD